MKKIFTLALSILTGSQLFAAAEFFIKINSNGNYTVSLNNQTITSSTSLFRFFDLYPGNYNLKVYENGFNGRVIYDKPVMVTDGYRTVSELNYNYGLTIIDKLPFTQQFWYIDHLITSQQPPVCGIPPKGPRPQKPNCGTHWNNGYGNGNQGWNNGYYPPVNTPGNYPYNGGNYGYGNLLDDASLQILIQTMKNVTFEDKMIEVAKTALKNRTVITSQVHQLLEQFTFEQNKLEVAKFCYDKTMDKYNYYTLYNDFTFNNYSTQLDKYINSR